MTFYRDTDIMKLVMDMTLQQVMKEKGLTRYQLSKTSGIPWATLSDICSGRTKLERCSGSTLVKLSGALGLSLEQLLALKVEEKRPQLKQTRRRPGSPPTCKRPSGNIWRGNAPTPNIWTASGMSCTALSTPTSGAVKSARPRRTT